MIVRHVLLAAFVVSLSLPGCIVVRHPVQGAGPRAADCPPGHVWSDGQCHAQGKGHDPNKHQGKGHDKPD